MSKGRTLFWVCFLGVAAALALGPQYFESQDPVVEPVVRSGPLAELRSADAGDHVPGRTAQLDKVTRSARVLRGADAAPATEPARSAPPAKDLFAARSWQLAPAPDASGPVRAAAPPRPMAAAVRQAAAQQAATPPAMPFRFIGKLEEGERLQVFLMRGAQLHVVQVGDLIDGEYRVDAISGTQMKLLFLPLQTAQTLTIGTAL